MTGFAVLSPAPSTVFLSGGSVLGSEGGTFLGTFRFLKDHWVDEKYIPAGEVHQMFTFWVPTADVEPLDTTAVNSFYAVGPTLGAVIRTQFSNIVISKPVTYWTQSGADLWNLTGLGASFPSVFAQPQRIEDKEP